jgi:hypothetical protein
MEQYKHTDNPFYNDIYSDTQTFKISGTPLEVIQSLAWVRALGGGHVKIGMGFLDAKSLYYNNVSGPEEFKGRLDKQDLLCIQQLTQNQKWIKSVEPWTGEIVDHDMDKIDYTIDKDNVFNMHPMDRFGKVLKAHWTQWQTVRLNSWLDIPANVGRPQGKGIVICGGGWRDRPAAYPAWRSQGIANVSTFVGNQEEYDDFTKTTGIKTSKVITNDVWTVATWISGAQQVIGTPGWGIALAQALNRPYLVQKEPNIAGWTDPWLLGERGNNGPF